MKVTKKLKAYMLRKGWIAEDASDDAIKAAVRKAVKNGSLSGERLATLTAAKATAGAGKGGSGSDPSGGRKRKKPAKKKAAAGVDPDELDRLVEEKLAAHVAKNKGDDDLKSLADLNPAKLYKSAGTVRVKEAVEQYSNTKSAAVCPDRTSQGNRHPTAGKQASFEGVSFDLPSDRDKAIAQAYFKFALARSNDRTNIPRNLRMTDHDHQLLAWSLRNSKWTGLIKGEFGDEPGMIGVNRRKMSEFEVKALLDDSVSGGIEIAPVEFDDALVMYPVLFGELFPRIAVTSTTRGRRIKGGSITNPTFTSGIAEGSAITPFNTASFVSSFDTNIYTAVASMEIGMDFEEDSPTNIGANILQKYGEKSMEWLDRVIAVGDGVTEPEGIFTSSAITVINSDNGPNSNPTVGDYEGLIFGVSKAFRNTKGSKNVFIGSDTSYRRARSIPVGPGDERRVFGMDHGSYQLLDHPYCIQNDIANTKIGFANLGYYRMYRRLGMNVRNETAGQYLATRNLRLLVVRMRWGGRIELGGSACVILDAQN